MRDTYDEFLAYYKYLSDLLPRCTAFKEITKARQVVVRATALLDANKRQELGNSDSRKAWVETRPEVVTAVCEYLYFKSLYDATEERRHGLSKSMDRIYRELMLRSENSEYDRQAKPTRKPGGFVPVR